MGGTARERPKMERKSLCEIRDRFIAIFLSESSIRGLFAVGQAGGGKAPEDWRSPKPGGMRCDLELREAFWSAPVLWRFGSVGYWDRHFPVAPGNSCRCPPRK